MGHQHDGEAAKKIFFAGTKFFGKGPRRTLTRCANQRLNDIGNDSTRYGRAIPLRKRCIRHNVAQFNEIHQILAQLVTVARGLSRFSRRG
jgi:hypothetical protein